MILSAWNEYKTKKKYENVGIWTGASLTNRKWLTIT